MSPQKIEAAMQVSKSAESEQINRRVLTLAPDHAYALSGLGSALARQGRIDEALPCFERAITLKPGWVEPHWDLAVALIDAGRFDEADAAIVRADEQLPRSRERFETLRAKVERRRQRQA